MNRKRVGPARKPGRKPMPPFSVDWHCVERGRAWTARRKLGARWADLVATGMAGLWHWRFILGGQSVAHGRTGTIFLAKKSAVNAVRRYLAEREAGKK